MGSSHNSGCKGVRPLESCTGPVGAGLPANASGQTILLFVLTLSRASPLPQGPVCADRSIRSPCTGARRRRSPHARCAGPHSRRCGTAGSLHPAG
ncbi:hypothetical protein FEM01_10205 [Pseudomonas mosselii]|uniref:Uncharacterized protein n=1 Tax=Pseudomonas mosselii TaxID=78327 RepID=A0A5R8Z8J8_9PSED|nr:hypothetical protein FEM01_10205 [Pseudomonas mosselii]